MSNFKSYLKAGYLYVVAGITLVMILIGSTMIIQNVITYNILDIKQERWGQSPEVTCEWKYQDPTTETTETSVPRPSESNYDSLEECIEAETKAIEEQAKIRYAYDMAQAVAMLLIAIPVWAYHWRLIRREDK